MVDCEKHSVGSMGWFPRNGWGLGSLRWLLRFLQIMLGLVKFCFGRTTLSNTLFEALPLLLSMAKEICDSMAANESYAEMAGTPFFERFIGLSSFSAETETNPFEFYDEILFARSGSVSPPSLHWRALV
jgi:hypothetical protein